MSVDVFLHRIANTTVYLRRPIGILDCGWRRLNLRHTVFRVESSPCSAALAARRVNDLEFDCCMCKLVNIIAEDELSLCEVSAREYLACGQVTPDEHLLLWQGHTLMRRVR